MLFAVFCFLVFVLEESTLRCAYHVGASFCMLLWCNLPFRFCTWFGFCYFAFYASAHHQLLASGRGSGRTRRRRATHPAAEHGVKL